MTQKNQDIRAVDRDLIVDRIYQIAVDPTTFDEFIDLWHDTDLSEQFRSDNVEPDQASHEPYNAHLERAHSILQRDDGTQLELGEVLKPYDNLSAFIIGSALKVEAANPGAWSAFGVKVGDALEKMDFPQEMKSALVNMSKEVLSHPKDMERLLKAEVSAKGGTILFRIMKLSQNFGVPLVLIISTHFYWRNATAKLLGSVFQLTPAEQDVVRLLVEGQDTKSIARTRKSGEGTVRSQIKSVQGKMNVRTQTDIVRLVMMLGEFPTDPHNSANGGEAGDTNGNSGAFFSGNWLEAEVWKPFKSIILPDGRACSYHDMGPPTGAPVLLTHLGSCMVRWPAFMVKMAFQHNIRIICPIRAGYGQSDFLPLDADPIAVARQDMVFLLQSLGIDRLPLFVQGTDFPIAMDMAANHSEMISEIIGIGGQPCIPEEKNSQKVGRWQSFFVSAAQSSTKLVHFAAKAVMGMSKRIGSEAMLKQLCKESPADLAILEHDEIKPILISNIDLMAKNSTDSARAFAMEYVAFHKDWSANIFKAKPIPTHIYVAEEDPTIDLDMIPVFKDLYPWIIFEILPHAGLAQIYQKPDILIPHMAEAAKRAKN